MTATGLEPKILVNRKMPKFWFSSYGQKCCWPVKLQDFLICNNSRKKSMMKFILGMQIEIKAFYKLILSLWVRLASHAQSTQNKICISLQTFQDVISRKTCVLNLIFCQQINMRSFYKLTVSLWM